MLPPLLRRLPSPFILYCHLLSEASPVYILCLPSRYKSSIKVTEEPSWCWIPQELWVEGLWGNIVIIMINKSR
jgi:nitric oxide reductase large subunit